MARLCMGGARQWFAHYGLSWDDFLTNGLPVERLEATGDAFALQVCNYARKGY